MKNAIISILQSIPHLLNTGISTTLTVSNSLVTVVDGSCRWSENVSSYPPSSHFIFSIVLFISWSVFACVGLPSNPPPHPCNLWRLLENGRGTGCVESSLYTSVWASEGSMLVWHSPSHIWLKCLVKSLNTSFLTLNDFLGYLWFVNKINDSSHDRMKISLKVSVFSL